MSESYVEPKTVLESVKSSTWRFFKFRLSGADVDKSYVHCKLCLDGGDGKRGQIKYCGGTTNMTNHLKACHKAEYKSVEKTEVPKQSILNHFVAEKKVPKWPKSSEKWKNLTMALAKWFCKSSRSTMMVKDPGFIAFLELACPEYDPPSTTTIAKYIKQLYDEKKNEICESLEEIEFCAVTTDGGASSDATSFQDTNVHYIDKEMNMKSHCLAVTENKEAHTAVNYRQNVDDVLDEFGIKEKVVKTITDNENKMRAAFSDEERSGCVAHILHSSITEGYKKTNEVKDVIEKNRKIATKFHKSYAFKYSLEEEQKKRGLPVRAILQDVPTRWGSTRSSTGSFLDKDEKDDEEEVNKGSEVFRDRFQNMEAINSALRKIQYRGDQKLVQYLLTQEDMARISTVNKFLTKLDIFTTTLGGANYVTSSVLLPVIASMKKMMQVDSNDSVYIAKLKEVILNEFNKRIATNVDVDFFALAAFLDPRWKDLRMIKKQDRDRAIERIEEEMNSLEKTSQPTREVEPAPKRRLLDFDESDEEGDEETEAMAAELRRFSANLIFGTWKFSFSLLFVTITWQVQKRACPTEGRGPSWMVENQNGAISNLSASCQEVPLRASHEHRGRKGLQLDGVLAEQEEAQLVRRQRLDAALPQRQPGTVNCVCFC